LLFDATTGPPLDCDGAMDDGDGGRSREKNLPLKDGTRGNRETTLLEEDPSSLSWLESCVDVGAVGHGQ